MSQADLPAEGASGAPELPAPPSPRRIVGIGGSAGALDGYERFFASMPTGSGLSFVVVPHLDPRHKGLMPQLLERCAAMPVVQIEDGMAAQPDQVYVVPPGKGVSLLGGVLLLSDLEGQPHQRLPIDAFFESLARDQGECSVGVVLSGSGSDGSRGVAAIKDRAGLVLVQDPLSAEYSAMPASAAATHLADYVAAPDELADLLYQLVTQPVTQAGTSLAAAADKNSPSSLALQKILLLIRNRTGQDFTQYKKSTVVRRIDRRMKGQQLSNLEQYARLLQDDSEEVLALFRDLTINVTSFFRDSEAFDHLAEHLRRALDRLPEEPSIFRVWVVGCSTGEEAYSLAMLLSELQDEGLGGAFKVQIFATDIDQDSLDKGREGFYPAAIAYALSPERLKRFFNLKADGYQVKSELRDMIVFALHNTFGDPPFTRLDLLSCRNMLIYLNGELQKQLLPMFHYTLRPQGLLFLGPSETIGQARELFTALDVRWKIFQRGAGPALPVHLGYSAPTLSVLNLNSNRLEVNRERRVQREAELPQTVQGLLGKWTPPAVVVDRLGTIQYVSGRTGLYLELPAGTASSNIVEMARLGLRYELAAALRTAAHENREVVHHNLRVVSGDVTSVVDLVVHPLQGAGSLDGLLLLVFAPPSQVVQPAAPSTGPASGEVASLQRELKYVREHLQATVEETEVSLEELKSTNEELQTTNEELQSSNEELMTSKEELQSLNEELITINTEHQLMISDLAQANDDMKNLLDGAGIATVFLDNTLRVKRFTPKITSIINLIPTDIGRPITDISTNLTSSFLARDIQQVLDTLTPLETEVNIRGDEWFLMRISPYRTFDNFIDGVVMVFTQIGPLKVLEQQLRDALLYATDILNSLSDPVLVLDHRLRVHTVNQTLLKLLRLSSDQAVGKLIYELGGGLLDIPELTERLREVSLGQGRLQDFLTDLTVGHQGSRKYKLNARRLVSDDAASELVVLVMEDIGEIVERVAREGSDLEDG